MKRITNVLQIVALALAALFIVSLFTSSFPPWSSDDEGGGGDEAAASTVVTAGTTAAPETTVGALTRPRTAQTQRQPQTPPQRVRSTARRSTTTSARRAMATTEGVASDPRCRTSRSSFPDQSEVVAIVTDGSGSMPSFGDDLSAEEIDAIVAYIYTFG